MKTIQRPKGGEESSRVRRRHASAALAWIAEDRLAASNFHGAKVIRAVADGPSLESRIHPQSR
jgi:hypothetical protein